MTKRVAIYARYSSDLQQATSIDDQIAMGSRLCETHNWQLVHIFRDEEITGRHTRRPGFQAMKAAIDRRE
ncbi:MAG: recombinase family protein, partial [Paracoccus sp. (in: a-proteobacteria)]|uniref:recombinase family protein n=1 Tax=Paracoccus sp. TaxID=267 RepID=UPI0026E063AD